MNRVSSPNDGSVVVLDRFICATRDSGYRGTVNALSEIIDNSIQAGAKSITVRIAESGEYPEHPWIVSVLDDGSGMDAATLRQALRFGGSTRFNDRSGLGRYGMGLPNSSLSQARRLEVFTWQRGGVPDYAYLDVDEIVQGAQTTISRPEKRSLNGHALGEQTRTGTLVVWSKCDRLDNRRVSTLERKIRLALGRIFRHFIWKGLQIRVNGEPVMPVDPLLLREPAVATGAVPFGDPIEYEIRVPGGRPGAEATGRVVVRFSELPVKRWSLLSNEEKRRLGITNGGGVSVVRAGREIDYGWFFMPGKRRENYDDWWRCEVSFDPELDESFGITHTKQQIRPQDHLLEVLGDELSEIARTLNQRVRRSYQSAKDQVRSKAAASIASARERELRPLPKRSTPPKEAALLEQVFKHDFPTLAADAKDAPQGASFGVIEKDFKAHDFFRPLRKDSTVIAAVNPQHRFYDAIYRRAKDLEETASDPALLRSIQLLLLAGARAEAALRTPEERKAVQNFLSEWSQVLDVYLR